MVRTSLAVLNSSPINPRRSSQVLIDFIEKALDQMTLERKHVNLYLAEFCSRFNRRHFQKMLYQRLMIAALAAPVCRYNKLVNSLADSK